MAAIHHDLDQLTDGLSERAEELAHRAEALVANSYPPGWVEPVYDGWRVCLPGRTPRSTTQLATIFPTKREAREALRAAERGVRGA